MQTTSLLAAGPPGGRVVVDVARLVEVVGGRVVGGNVVGDTVVGGNVVDDMVVATSLVVLEG
jgi:hypothetical protein